MSAPSREDWELGYDSEPRGCNLGCLLVILAALYLAYRDSAPASSAAASAARFFR